MKNDILAHFMLQIFYLLFPAAFDSKQKTFS